MRFLIIVVVLTFNITSSLQAAALLPNEITVYKNPDCRCCDKWIRYLQEHDYAVTVVNTRDVYAHKRRLGVPPEAAACHTAVIGDYVIEGHITHRDIKRLLLFQPEIKGIAVPGMPIGTPGMERGSTKEPYNVMSFDEAGSIDIFVKH